MTTLVIDRTHRGPAVSGNGGYTAGLLAETLGGGLEGAVEVTLRLPPPLDRPLAVERSEDRASLLDGDALVAEAVRTSTPDVELVPVDVATAEDAATRYPGFRHHPFPGCFTCGTDREPGDGLRVFAGPTADPGVFAAPWDTRALGALTVPVVWAAMDCPSGWAVDIEGRPAVLGRMTAAIDALPTPGHTLVVVSTLLQEEGRKAMTASALYDGQRLLARARQVWIRVDPDVFNG